MTDKTTGEKPFGPFADESELDEALARPGPGLAEDLARAPGDIAILGVGGKMGPSLARMARRADPGRRVLAIARFSEPGLRETLQAEGIETVKADLLARDAVAALPDAGNVESLSSILTAMSGITRESG